MIKFQGKEVTLCQYKVNFYAKMTFEVVDWVG